MDLFNTALKYMVRVLRIRRIAKSKSTLVSVGTAVVFLAVACTGATTNTGADPRPADAAPDVQLKLFGNDDHEAGEQFSLSALEGSPVVLNFWFPSCFPCVAEMPDLEKAYQKHKSDGLEMVGVQLVGLDTAEAGQEFVNMIGVNYAIGPDETGEIVTKDYKVPGFPTTVFLDSEHNISRTWTGILNEEKLEELIGEILN